MQTRFVRRPDGARIAYQSGGLPDGPPLLLLQGQANSHRWWHGIRDGFEQTHRTITVDYRGTGSSTAHESLNEGWSTETFAEDVVAVLDDLRLDTADVYGTSMGGRVGQMLAIRHPARVGRLVLACTSPGGRLAHERDASVRRLLADPDPTVRRETLLDLMYTPVWSRTNRSSNLLGDPTMSPVAARLHLRVSGRHDAYDLLPQIDSPTLVLHGTEDRMTPAINAELIAQRIPDATVRLTDGGRHGFFDEFRHDVTARVLAFLTR